MKTQKANGVEYYLGEQREIVMVNPKTIKLYEQLCDVNKKSVIDFDDCGLFWAFDDKQFDEGLAKIKERGLFVEGEDKLVAIDGGGYLPKKLVPKLKDMLANSRKTKTECNPQEVYFYEYNNRECMYDWHGEQSAYDEVVYIFGIEIAKTIKRINRYGC